MKIAVIGFTQNGLKLEKKLKPILEKLGHEARFFVKSKYIEKVSPGEELVNDSLQEWGEKWIPGQEGIIFIGAAGIAVRTMAPYVKSKRTDPAVVVIDEKGQFVISLLSGHLGGANQLTEEIAEHLAAIPVITTATDVNHKFAVDVFAKKNHLWISDMTLAKEVSARILRGERLTAGMGTGFRKGEKIFNCPELILEERDSPDGRKGSFWIQVEEGKILHLFPKNLVLGVGCRRGITEEKIEETVKKVLDKYEINSHRIKKIASIDLKKEEPGLVAAAKHWKLPFETFSSEELQKTEGEFSCSAFVNQITGVDNVCERSAVLGSRGGVLLIKKQAREGVTVACALEEWSVEGE